MAKQTGTKKTLWLRNVALTFAGGAAFVIGLSFGNIAGGNSPDPITIEPIAIPQVDNSFCDVAPVTCAPYLEQIDETAEIVFSTAALSA